MDSFFSKGFKASKCKTLLKLTIPRIKLLRNRREIQLKQMRREIAKLLETGQEATARIRVEHIIREEKMMAAQEIIELFCELIAVRLPIIEAQKECPLDLKEAISSICFSAPRCADLPELHQVQMLFAVRYGKEFVAAATELRPECGVNRQLIQLLSIRAPDPDVKLKLLKEIAEEHELDWDPNASEIALLKPHEDLLNGPTQFATGSKVPLPNEKYEKSPHAVSEPTHSEQPDSDSGLDSLDFPEVPKQPLRPSAGVVSAPEMLPFPDSVRTELDGESMGPCGTSEGPSKKPEEKVVPENAAKEYESAINHNHESEVKQFVPFIAPPPSQSSTSDFVRQSNPAISSTSAKRDSHVDLQDVLAAAQAAAETAERAAAAARSAASLAQIRISELVGKKTDEFDGNIENPFHAKTEEAELAQKLHLEHKSSMGESDDDLRSLNPHHTNTDNPTAQLSDDPSYGDAKVEYDSSQSYTQALGQGATHHQFQRLPSMEDESYLSYPNLFTPKGSHLDSRSNSFTESSK